MRIASFDIETTDLRANMGTLLCASFHEIVPPGYYSNHHDKPNKPYTFKVDYKAMKHGDPNPDKELAISLRNEIEKYNGIVTWNGKMFDVPFLNARLLFHRERPVHIQFHIDAMYYAGSSSNRIGSRRLVSVQQFLGLEHSKTSLDWDIWKAATRGDSKALKYIVDHCEADVQVLTEAYWRLLPYIANIHR
jgi:uncharacterized protein YprB with RNaseH-like and TPR domain